MAKKPDSKGGKKQQKKIRRPNPFLYYPLLFLAGLYFKFKLKVTYDRTGLKDLKGPALFICPHISNIDFVLAALALKPYRPTFVGSEHFMSRPLIRWFLTQMAVIPKKMYCADIRTILTIMRAKEQGHLIVIYPEGRLTCFGHSVNLTEGTPELVKKLGVDVYTITGNGAYLSLPKWGKAGFRSGRIHVTTEKLISKDDIGTLSLSEIEEILERAILHDEDQVAREMMSGVTYKCKQPAAGLDGILYKCPICGAEFQMETVTTTIGKDADAQNTLSGNQIYCRACDFTATLDQSYQIHGGPFTSINQWFLWQQDQIDLDIPLESEVTISAVGKDGNRDLNAGSGHIRMNRETIEVEGVVFGEPLIFTEKTSSVKALPASVGSHFDIYHKKIMYNFHLKPDPRANMKWVGYLDKLNENIKH